MLQIRSFLLAALAVPLVFTACGGGDDDDEEVVVVPEGTHHGYVVSSVTAVPAPPHSPTEQGYGLDLGGKTSKKLDGRIDNNLGEAFRVLGGIDEALDVQATLKTAVDQGDVILLVDFQSKDFTNSNAGFSVKFGTNPNPLPCSGDVCRQHLMGGASFQLASNSPTGVVTGTLANGAFEGGPGQLALQITIGSTTPIVLPLIRARVKITSVSETSLTALVAGLIPAQDLITNVGGALQGPLTDLLSSSCTNLDVAHAEAFCGCTGLAVQLMQLIDGDTGTPRDCLLSPEEILSNPATGANTSPDVCSMDTCAKADAVSIGLNIEAVAATFPM